MPLATCRTAASKTGLVGACARCRAVPRCAPGPPPTGGTGFGSGIAGKCKCVCVCNNGDKSQAAGWEGAGGAGREAHQQEPRWTFSTCPRKASNARPRDRPPEPPRRGAQARPIGAASAQLVARREEKSMQRVRYYDPSESGCLPGRAKIAQVSRLCGCIFTRLGMSKALYDMI